MTCDDLESLLHPYLDGEFDQEERFDFERHLAGCPSCTHRIQEAQAFRRAIRGRGREAAHRPAPDALRASLRSGMRSAQRRELFAFWAKTSAAAAAAVLLVGAGWKLLPRAEEKFVSDAALRHARGLPFEIEHSTPETVEAWFGGKLDHRVPVPRLQNAKVAGARLSNVTDRPAAYISYDTAGDRAASRRLGLFVFDDSSGDVDAEPLPRIAVKNRHGYNVALWRQGEIVYELVTDLDEADIRRMLIEQNDPAVAVPDSGPQQSFPTESPPALTQLPRTPSVSIQHASFPR